MHQLLRGMHQLLRGMHQLLRGMHLKLPFFHTVIRDAFASTPLQQNACVSRKQ
jgi:hypothetical protein